MDVFDLIRGKTKERSSPDRLEYFYLPNNNSVSSKAAPPLRTAAVAVMNSSFAIQSDE
jgi:hypothetical protein